MPPSRAPTQGTIALTAEQWTATQATLQRLKTRLNNQQRSQSSRRSHSCESRNSRHRDNRPNALKPKAPDAYNGRSHKELYKFLRQCTKYFRVMRVDIDDPGLPPDHVVTWAEFKKTLRDDLGDKDAFINKTWSNFFTYHQRQGKTVRAFSVTLQQIYAVLREYDPIAAPTESMMIRCMRHAICPEIRAVLYNTGERVENFTIFMNKVMSAEASAAMRAAGAARTNKRNRSRDASSEQPNHHDKSASNKRGKKHDRDSETNTGRSNTSATDSDADAAEVICFTCNKPGHKSPACPNKPKPKSRN
ncbi:hypothetical protein MMC22_005709 [Lobaria immixta]|nr:hypothetical protein [Lobaria immixta]